MTDEERTKQRQKKGNSLHLNPKQIFKKSLKAI